MDQRKRENDCLWMLKGISCIIVILFHCPIKGIIGDGIIYALRFPIPIFFMSTGYFMYRGTNYCRKIKTFLKHLIFAESVACISLIIKSVIDSSFDDLFSRMSSSLNLKTIFFGSVFNGTLWYLYAMIWTYIILYILSRCKYGFTMGYCSIPLLLFIHIAGRVYVTNHYDINEWVFLFRSAILFALPFVLIGRLIAEKQDKLSKFLNYYSIGGIFCVGILLMVFEYFKWQRFMDLQVSTIFISISLFLFALYKPDFKLLGIFKYIGKSLLLYVYIFHIPVYTIVKLVFESAKVENHNLTTLTVVVVTIGISYIWVKITNMIKANMSKRQVSYHGQG